MSKNCIGLNAAGRDFIDYNIYLRNNKQHGIAAFSRRDPAKNILEGMRSKKDIDKLIKDNITDEYNFSYSFNLSRQKRLLYFKSTVL